MAKRSAILRLLAFVAVLGGGSCGRTELMNYGPRPGIAFEAPSAAQALVVFIRMATGPEASSIFEEREFLGVLMGRTYFVLATAPGKHRFMVVSEAADFMDADLEGGKVYFARVEPRMGVWRARFSMLPIAPDDPQWRDVPAWLAEATRVTTNAAGRSWAQENATSIGEKYTTYLAEWLRKADKPILHREDGIPFRQIPRVEAPPTPEPGEVGGRRQPR